MAQSAYKRILLKVSGEALSGDQSFGINPEFLGKVAGLIAVVSRAGIDVAIDTGGGNISRGLSVAADGADRVTADMMGTLGTIINSLALSSALTRAGVKAKVFSAITMPSIADSYTARAAKAALDDGYVVVLGGGIANPFFTTDTAAALRAIDELVLDKNSRKFRDQLAIELAHLIYDGRWYTPLREALFASTEVFARDCSGEVVVKLYKGVATAVQKKSANSLYSEAFATFGADEVYNQSHAEGFIRLYSLSTRIKALKQEN